MRREGFITRRVEVTRRAGAFSYSKSITEALLWAQKGQGGPAPIGTFDPRKLKIQKIHNITKAIWIREVLDCMLKLLLR